MNKKELLEYVDVLMAAVNICTAGWGLGQVRKDAGYQYAMDLYYKAMGLAVTRDKAGYLVSCKPLQEVRQCVR